MNIAAPLTMPKRTWHAVLADAQRAALNKVIAALGNDAGEPRPGEGCFVVPMRPGAVVPAAVLASFVAGPVSDYLAEPGSLTVFYNKSEKLRMLETASEKHQVAVTVAGMRLLPHASTELEGRLTALTVRAARIIAGSTCTERPRRGGSVELVVGAPALLAKEVAELASVAERNGALVSAHFPKGGLELLVDVECM